MRVLGPMCPRRSYAYVHIISYDYDVYIRMYIYIYIDQLLQQFVVAFAAEVAWHAAWLVLIQKFPHRRGGQRNLVE